MGQKVHPIGFRLGAYREWRSRWFAPRSFRQYLREDVVLHQWLRTKLRRAMVTEVRFERLSGGKLQLVISTARPGILIGRGGGGIDELRKELKAKLSVLRGGGVLEDVRVEVQEVQNPDAHAAIIAQSIADQLERRMPFRRVLNRSLERALAAKGILGGKIAISGRLGGAEMRRREWVHGGRVPLQTLRADIDFAQDEAHTTWGVIGVKVWLYKGEIFHEKTKASNRTGKNFTPNYK